MTMNSDFTLLAVLAFALTVMPAPGQSAAQSPPPAPAQVPVMDASAFGFSPAASGLDNTRALQCAVDQTGTIVVSRPGIYQLAGTVFIGSDTSLVFGARLSAPGPRQTLHHPQCHLSNLR